MQFWWNTASITRGDVQGFHYARIAQCDTAMVVLTQWSVLSLLGSIMEIQHTPSH